VPDGFLRRKLKLSTDAYSILTVRQFINSLTLCGKSRQEKHQTPLPEQLNNLQAALCDYTAELPNSRKKLFCLKGDTYESSLTYVTEICIIYSKF
jgi:hypothetical protein